MGLFGAIEIFDMCGVFFFLAFFLFLYFHAKSTRDRVVVVIGGISVVAVGVGLKLSGVGQQPRLDGDKVQVEAKGMPSSDVARPQEQKGEAARVPKWVGLVGVLAVACTGAGLVYGWRKGFGTGLETLFSLSMMGALLSIGSVLIVASWCPEIVAIVLALPLGLLFVISMLGLMLTLVLWLW